MADVIVRKADKPQPCNRCSELTTRVEDRQSRFAETWDYQTQKIVDGPWKRYLCDDCENELTIATYRMPL
jgi:uncharacterized protein YlaI